ncbi:small hydrophobic protein [Miniopterus schreibersii paramyxovirus]|uniref:small hydrophobic protein n=1 Tax=Miniopterus schreibersii paramyxovirus TaxID=1387879 RepID=UPI0003D88CE5|nr:small hydrophobic protein [Miniopterus schreibersii paramyxovirus]AGU69455.1 small hydrophobic protein [Miniopterus schreibersii paramyxovirus]
MDSEHGSSIYVNTAHVNRIQRSNRHNRDTTMSTQDLHLKIETINTINKFRSEIKRINKCLLISIVSMVFILLLTSVIIGLVLNYTYTDLSKKIDNENEQIYLMMQKLYTKCKENPMDFDWTTAIFQRIEDAENKIPDVVLKRIMLSFDKRFKDALKEGKISDDSIFKFHVKFDKAEGLEIDAKAAGSDEKSSQARYLPLPTYSRRFWPWPPPPTNPQTTTPWRGPTGIPGIY